MNPLPVIKNFPGKIALFSIPSVFLYGLIYLVQCKKEEDHKQLNLLQHEKSPYLLRHKENPVQWQPWSDAAFEKAKKEDKPIFLSIGYSTCHWCRVMEEESFSNAEVAKSLNSVFIPIKVDREERPDVDLLYMKACQLMSDTCGWPLTLILTPEGKPFYAGTYHPPESRDGRLGLIELSKRAKEMWELNREKADELAREMSLAIEKEGIAQKKGAVGKNTLDQAYTVYAKSFNQRYGGFNDTPGFPQSAKLRFLFYYYNSTGQKDALQMAEKTLLSIASGNIRDQIKGGFHRYTIDPGWSRPHFEKMLYDQALLAAAFIEAYQITKQETYSYLAKETMDFVIENMKSEEGTFYSAFDSAGESGEGSYYLFEENEIQDVLDKKEQEIFFKFYSMQYSGPGPGSQEQKKTLIAGYTGKIHPDHLIPSEDVRKILNRLSTYRNDREDLFLDKKIQTNWNALMISALARTGAVLQNKHYSDAAVRCADFFLEASKESDSGKLSHVYAEGKNIPGNLDDYAYMIQAMLDLYSVNFNVKYLKAAVDLDRYLAENFKDAGGGFYFTETGSNTNLFMRSVEIADGETPSGNAVSINNHLRLYRITGDIKYLNTAKKTAERSSASEKLYYTSPGAMFSLAGLIYPGFEIVLSGDPEDDVMKSMLAIINKTYLPGSVTVLRPLHSKEIIKIAPHTEYQKPVNGRTTAYVCKNFICNRPVTDPDLLTKLLNTENRVTQ